MSNSSDPVDDLLLSAEFLNAVAGECSLLSRQIATLGDALSENIVRNGDPVLMQQFDRLSQGAQAHARLVGFVAQGLLSGRPRGAQDLKDISDTIPLAEIRGRLRLLLGLCAEDAGNDSDDFWEDEPEARAS